jgi:hypothetical protein
MLTDRPTESINEHCRVNGARISDMRQLLELAQELQFCQCDPAYDLLL